MVRIISRAPDGSILTHRVREFMVQDALAALKAQGHKVRALTASGTAQEFRGRTFGQILERGGCDVRA